jgi:hypothetical protein
MTTALSRPSATARRSSSRRGDHARGFAPPSMPTSHGEGIAIGCPLARYLDAEGRTRELLTIPGHAGSTLVLDRDAATLCDRRLVAHLAADEPHENAVVVCRHYLADTNGRWCRRVRPEDLESVPLVRGVTDSQASTANSSRARNQVHLDNRNDACGAVAISSGKDICADVDVERCEAGQLDDDHCVAVQPDIEAPVFDGKGNAYRLVALAGEGSTPQLRWCRRRADADDDRWEQTALRDVVAALESYEPMRTLTERAVAAHRHDSRILVTRVCCELERLYASPVVLNRALREAVLDAIDRRDMSMSEIALRCGIVKRDRRGKVSGETSWLARRVGIMPEGGETEITPWVHSDVLATIARKGLGISPREVELQ